MQNPGAVLQVAAILLPFIGPYKIIPFSLLFLTTRQASRGKCNGPGNLSPEQPFPVIQMKLENPSFTYSNDQPLFQ